ncbi:MAG: nickel pincer cofactor biosynthesis protein LarC, partial [Acaryochloridaceae cyanobacterium RL_2_7]|nr:nickel pincer cofactor biosynthesis protein LarC [Acaryochloridaceae cyanobacterium RL_2_7]
LQIERYLAPPATRHKSVRGPSRTHTATRARISDNCFRRNGILPLKTRRLPTTTCDRGGNVHGMSPDKVHFHEVGAVDAMIDIVGTCLGLHWLGIETIYCSPLPTGGGTVKAAHGILPVPVPAVLQLWAQRNVPVYSNGIEMELVTPTGAAIAVTLAKSFGTPPPMSLKQVALGAGQAELSVPNALRLWIGEDSNSGQNLEEVMLLETQVDDLNPQVMGWVFEQLLAAGALDVWTQAVGMKKQRSGLLISVVCPPLKMERCEDILFRETTTLGIRRSPQTRHILDREFHPVETPYGTVAVKIARKDGEIWNVQPEYEDCLKIAQVQNLPWWQIQQLVLHHWHRNQDR